MHSRVLTIILLALGLSVGSQVVLETEAEAGPFGTLSKSRKGGKRTHKKAKSSKSKKSSSKRKSSSKKSSTSRRKVGSTTRRTSPSSRTNTRSRRTVRRSRPSSRRTSSRTSSRRTSSRTSSRRTTSRRTTNVRPRTRTTTRRTRTVRRSPRRRGSRVRHTTYHRSGSTHHHHGSSSRRSSSASRGGSQSAVEAYVTGGLGISGFASNEITDLPLPGAGYNLAVGAKSGIFGGELGFNGGGYTFDPANPSTDIGLVGLAADFKLQPSIGFFEPYAKAGIGGYSFADGVIDETASGVGLRLGAGADFRFRSVAFRLSYLHATYGLGDHNGGFGGSLTAHTETLGGNVVVYF